MTTPPTSLSRHVGSLLLISGLAILAIAKEVLVPIALATLLAVVLTPVVRWMVARRIPNLISVGLVVGTLSICTLLIGVIIFGQISQVADKLMQYRQNIHDRLAELSSRHGAVSRATVTIQTLQHELETIDTQKPSIIAPVAHESSSIKPQPVVIIDEQRIGIQDLFPLLATSLQPMAITGLTLLLATFMIVQRADIQRRFTLLSEWMAKRGMSTITSGAVEEMIERIGTYLLLQSSLNLIAGILIAGVIAILGLPNALLWGLLTTLLRFVPYLGIAIAAGVTLLFAVAVSPSWVVPLQILTLFVVVELVMANVVEPIVLGHGTGLSSLGILVATAFWTWIWGPMGLFLAIPLTVCLVSIGRHVTSLTYLEILLADPLPDKLLEKAEHIDQNPPELAEVRG